MDAVGFAVIMCTVFIAFIAMIGILDSFSHSDIGDGGSQHSSECRVSRTYELHDEYNGKIVERWEKQAEKHIDAMERDFYRLLDGDVSNADIASIRQIRNHALAQYDAYWKWTEKCADECNTDAEKTKLWNRAKRDFKFQFGDGATIDLGIKTWWGTPSNKSVRTQIADRLDKRLDELRPEYLRKTKLIKDMMDTVASKDTMLRCDLMNTPFEGVTKSEVESMYRVMIRENRLFEMKIDTRYIVSLSDKERAKREKAPQKQTKRE